MTQVDTNHNWLGILPTTLEHSTFETMHELILNRETLKNVLRPNCFASYDFISFFKKMYHQHYKIFKNYQ